MRAMVRRRCAVAALVVAGAVALGACSSGSGGDDASGAAPTSSTAPVAGTAKVASFDVPASVECAASDTDTTFTVSWKVTDAQKSVIQLDGAPIPETDQRSGSVQASVHCDPLPHDVVLIATDANGHLTTDRKILTTNGGAGS